MLSKDIISSMLPDTLVEVYKVTDSTNTRAIKLSEETKKNVLAVSEEQTQGRGRQGKSFYSPPGGGVYFSLVIRPDGELNDIVFVTSAAAVAVAKTIEEMTGLEPKIKWVNDIFLSAKSVRLTIKLIY